MFMPPGNPIILIKSNLFSMAAISVKWSIGLHEDNMAKIRDAPRPTTKKQIRSFMGLARYY